MKHHDLPGVLRPIFVLSVSALTLLAAAAPTHPASAREHILLDADWRFKQDAASTLANAVPIRDWRLKTETSGEADLAEVLKSDPGGAGWQDARTGDDAFKGRLGFVWFTTVLPKLDAPNRILEFAGVDDNGTVFLNGKKLVHHEGWNDPFEVSLDGAWKPGGPNVLLVLVENTDGPGGITGSVTLGTSQAGGGDAAARPDYDDRGWRTVHLPHDYVVEQRFTPDTAVNHGSLPTPTAWYRKTFTLPASDRGKSVWIDFEGIYRDSVVYLNGIKLGEHQSGYTSFRYDIGKQARFGRKNVLAVHVNPRRFEGWWYEGGGIYRHVWLNVADPVHVAPWGTFVTASLPEPGVNGTVAPATISMETTVKNDSGVAADCTVVSTIRDESGAAVAVAKQETAVEPGQMQKVAQQAGVPQPHLWSLEKPTLYSLHTDIVRDGKVIDSVDTPFGIRTIRYDADTGFYLNGKPVKIQGVCNHQDFAGVGVAVPDSLEEYRVRRLKEMGVNGWRMSHNPPTPSLLDACDRLGMLVMDENRHLGDTYTDHTNHGTGYSDLSDLADMIQRDRNHPSIVMWSMCNEEGLQGSPEGARIFSAMMKVVHKYDTTRPISCAMNGGWLEDGIAGVEDLLGVNYSYWVYDRAHAQYPHKPMFGSETASTVTARGVYADDREHAWVSSYNLTDGSWEPVGSRPFIAGSFAWTGFDYKGEPSPFGWPEINSNFGILDMCGFPKDNYYYLQSWWTDQPVLHLMPHWNWKGKEGSEIRVVCFSNASRVELFLNGQSLGTKDMPRLGHIEWKVAYAPGTLSAVGYDAQGGRVSSTKVVTTGAPASLRLSTDRTVLAADGEDVQPVKVEVLDAQGNVVPTADDLVSFAVTGAGHVAGVGNGNPSDHDPDKASYRHAFNGLCMVVVGAGEKAGSITVVATSPGLKPARLLLKTR
jgi:beta-galactosidase